MSTTITEQNLLRPYQEKAIQAILLEPKGLVKMFCGTGKSIIMTEVIIHEKKELNVLVFPSLALIQQYWTAYVEKYFPKYKKISISSLEEKNAESGEITIKSTTDSKEIKQFLKGKGQKIALVTYHSYEVLLNCLEGKKINLVCYDEAHHVTSPKYQKLVFGTPYFEKERFFTATPKNENGITMFDRDDPEKNMCGPVVFEYTYLQALYDANGPYVNAFEVCIDMYTENTNASIYEAMARAILSKGTNRVLSFHSGVEGESNTDVKKFVKEAEFQAVFQQILMAEFREKQLDYTKITFKGMDGSTPAAERKVMLEALGKTPANEIYIISSCETIGEGVDTNKANMCVFADPKSSITKIIQNIGRVVRPNPECPVSTILIPCWVNMENYAAANGDRVKQDELIRQQMRSEKGDYTPILNVLGALKQEDPEMYEMCLYYSDSRHDKSESEDDDSASEADTDSDSASEADSDEEESDSASEADSDEEESDSASEADSDEEESDSASEAETDIEDRRPNKRIRMSIHQNDAIQMLWGVKGELDFSQKFCSVVIECEVSYGVECWRLKHTQLIAYIEEHKQLPSTVDQKSEIRTLGRWVNTQQKNYPKNVYIMLNPEIRSEWETTLQKYGDYLGNQFKKWSLKHTQLIAYMDKEKKTPSGKDKNPVIKKLGQWVSDQKKYYKKNLHGMSNKDIRSEWETTLQKYGDYLSPNTAGEWRLKHAQLIVYMEKEKKSPSDKNKNPVIKTLGTWLGTQKTNYRRNVYMMKKNPDIRTEWETTLQKYGDYLCDPCEKWRLKHAQLIAYINEHKKRPSEDDKTPEIKKIGSWTSEQIQYYKKNIHMMKNNPDIRTAWETTLVKYREYLKQPIIPLPTQPEAPPPKKRTKKQTAIPIATQPEAPPVQEPTPVAPIQAAETPPKKIKIKKKVQVILQKSYADLTEAEKQKICEKVLKKRQEEKGYRTTNPDDKDIINGVFAKNIRTTAAGKIVFLDHKEFKTAYALLECGVKPEDMLIPQRPDNYPEMAKHELFGSSVVLGEFNEVLTKYMETGGAVKGVYADYCSTLEKDGFPFMELLTKYKANLSADAVVGVTITLRNPEGVRYSGQDICMLEKKLNRSFPNGENLFYTERIIPEDDGPYTYGNGAPMATWLIRM